MASLDDVRRAGRPLGLPSAVWLSLLAGLTGLLLGVGVHEWLMGCSGSRAAAAVVMAAGTSLDASRASSTRASLTGQQQQQQEQQQQQQTDAPGAAPPGGFRPDGYTLPQECEKHTPLYIGIFEDLRPWLERGITRADLDACIKVAPAGHNISLGTPQTDALRGRFRLLSWNNEIFVTSGGLERVQEWGQQRLHYHMITEIERAAKRFGLPNIEAAVGFGDSVIVDPPGARTSFPEAMCPLLVYCKFAALYNNILIPSGEFLLSGFVSRMLQEDPVPWEQKEERAIGRWTLVPTWNRGVNRWGQDVDSREWYVNHSVASQHRYIHFMSSGMPGAHMPLAEQRSYKYTLNTDGYATSGRFTKLLATGQTVIKQDSQLIEFYYRGLQPWVHYVPTGYNGPEEIDRIVQFLRQHDQLARWIAGNSQRFAATHLVSEGRLCFIKVLFEEMAKLMRYKVDSLEEFPARITYSDDKDRYLLCKECFAKVDRD